VPERPTAQETGKHLLRMLRAWKAEQPPVFILLGLGSGDLAAELDRSLPGGVRVIVSELVPENALEILSRGRTSWWSGSGRTQLLADTSIWSHFFLWTLAGMTPRNSFIRLNPETTRKNEDYKTLRNAFLHSKPLDQARDSGSSSLTVASILSPSEKKADEFFRHIPNYAEEVVAIWDAKTLPGVDYEAGRVTRHLARPLNDDFAAQRNYMLANCHSEWILYLDADERLPRGVWKALPSLIRSAESAGAGGVYFPRLTFYPDGSHCLIGYGLWPDLQLRLFRNTAGLRFVEPVHERLKGVEQPHAVVLNGPIHHYNRLYKSDEEVRNKLAAFDRAGGRKTVHRLSDDYPTLSSAFFPTLARGERLHAMVLPKKT
jgi:glycosyltransferase involved in cell wall biosynthesis